MLPLGYQVWTHVHPSPVWACSMFLAETQHCTYRKVVMIFMSNDYELLFAKSEQQHNYLASDFLVTSL